MVHFDQMKHQDWPSDQLQLILSQRLEVGKSRPWLGQKESEDRRGTLGLTISCPDLIEAIA